MNQNDIREALKHFKSLQKRYTTQHNGKHCKYVETVISALEKQAAKKCETDEENNFYNCPCCNEDLMGCYGENDEIANYCLWCGQKLDWSNNSEC